MNSENKKEYIEFCQKHTDICIFSTSWWLDNTAGENNWDVIIIKNNNNEIIATFPIYIIKKRFQTTITNPMLTQKLGPYIVYPANMKSHEKRISYEHEIYKKIINQLPKFEYLNISFDQKYKNWLPFYWNSFHQESHYSYRIFNIKNHDDVFNKFNGSKRTLIRKANNLLVKSDLDYNEFYDFFEQCIKQRKEMVLYTRNYFINLCKAVYKNKQGKIFYCIDENKRIHAIDFVVWDKECAYYLIAMRKDEYKNSGATELLVYETIKYVSSFVDIFDFEGSMQEGIEEAYRKYGAQQSEYYTIYKDNRSLAKKAGYSFFNKLVILKRKLL